MAATGKPASGAFSSCRQMMSGASFSSHSSRFARREATPLTLKVASLSTIQNQGQTTFFLLAKLRTRCQRSRTRLASRRALVHQPLQGKCRDADDDERAPREVVIAAPVEHQPAHPGAEER